MIMWYNVGRNVESHLSELKVYERGNVEWHFVELISCLTHILLNLKVSEVPFC
jgi:hypothetical protein